MIWGVCPGLLTWTRLRAPGHTGAPRADGGIFP